METGPRNGCSNDGGFHEKEAILDIWTAANPVPRNHNIPNVQGVESARGEQDRWARFGDRLKRRLSGIPLAGRILDIY